MISLTESEFREKAENAYRAVFAHADPYGEPFTPRMHPRLLLYGFRYILHDPWLNPVTKTIDALGENGFYVTALERPETHNLSQHYHWFVSLSEASSYGSVIYSQKNAIYSTMGRWGIVVSDEDHALVGGVKLLIENILDFVPDIDDRVSAFLETWKHYHLVNQVDIKWIGNLLSHIYGENKASEFLMEANLEGLIASSQ